MTIELVAGGEWEAVAGGAVCTDELRPPTMVSIDPGGAHCGVALFISKDGLLSAPEADWHCHATWETTPADCLLLVRALLHTEWDSSEVEAELLVERFALYAEEAMSLVGSEMETSQVIGVLKYLHAWYGHPGVRWVQQPASIQGPTKKILRAKGITSVSKKTKAGPHALSAELHGWYRLMRGRQQ